MRKANIKVTEENVVYSPKKWFRCVAILRWISNYAAVVIALDGFFFGSMLNLLTLSGGV